MWSCQSQANPVCKHLLTVTSEESSTSSSLHHVKRVKGLGVQAPPSGIDFDAHDCFFAPEVGSFYATHWVAPIVSPLEHAGHLKNCDYYNFCDVFPAAPASEFLPYIKIVTVSGDPYSPYETDSCLPNKFREFDHCASCGRKARDDCWAMGAMMNYENQMATQDTHMACVYCATYGALGEFLQYDWCGMLQLQELVARKRVMKDGINRTLAYLQAAITASVIKFKRQHAGQLPAHARTTYVLANDTGSDTCQTGLRPDYEYFSDQRIIANFDLKAHRPMV